MRFIVTAGVVVLLCTVSGCGANPDSLVKEQIKTMNELAGAMESNAPESRVKELQQQLEQTSKKLQALKLSDEDKKKLQERHQAELTEAGMRLAKAAMSKAIGEAGKMFGGSFPGMPNPGNLPGLPGAGGTPPGFPSAEKKD